MFGQYEKKNEPPASKECLDGIRSDGYLDRDFPNFCFNICADVRYRVCTPNRYRDDGYSFRDHKKCVALYSENIFKMADRLKLTACVMQSLLADIAKAIFPYCEDAVDEFRVSPIKFKIDVEFRKDFQAYITRFSGICLQEFNGKKIAKEILDSKVVNSCVVSTNQALNDGVTVVVNQENAGKKFSW